MFRLPWRLSLAVFPNGSPGGITNRGQSLAFPFVSREMLLLTFSPIPREGSALEEGDAARIARNQEFLRMLRDASCEKLDAATAHLLGHWDEFSRGDEVNYVLNINSVQPEPSAHLLGIDIHLTKHLLCYDLDYFRLLRRRFSRQGGVQQEGVWRP